MSLSEELVMIMDVSTNQAITATTAQETTAVTAQETTAVTAQETTATTAQDNARVDYNSSIALIIAMVSLCICVFDRILKSKMSSISVSTFSKKQIKEEYDYPITVSKIFVWNSCNRIISGKKSRNVKSPLSIKPKSDNCHIIKSCTVFPQNELFAKPLCNPSNEKFEYKFDRLNTREGFIVEIIHTGDLKKDFEIDYQAFNCKVKKTYGKATNIRDQILNLIATCITIISIPVGFSVAIIVLSVNIYNIVGFFLSLMVTIFIFSLLSLIYVTKYNYGNVIPFKLFRNCKKK